MNRSDVHARARALMDVRRHHEAVRLLGHELARDPDDIEGWCLLALAHLRASDPASCLDAAEKAASLAPLYDWPMRLRALALLRLGRLPAAREAAMAARAAAPDNPLSHIVIGEVALASGQRAEVTAAANAALALNPKLGRAHWLMAEMALRAGLPRKAERCARAALALDADDIEAAATLGVALARRGRRRQAAAVLDRVIATDPTWAHARRLQRDIARLSPQAKLVLTATVVGLVAGVAGLGDPDRRSRHAAAIVVAVAAVLFLVEVGAWVLRRRALPRTARVLLAEHASGRRRSSSRTGPAIALSVLAAFGLLVVAGYLSDPSQYTPAGWAVAVLFAAGAAWCVWLARPWQLLRRFLLRRGEHQQ